MNDDLHFGVIVCEHVLAATRPVRAVYHEADGDWQFMCGEEDHDFENSAVVGASHLIERDATLRPLVDIERNRIAWRESADSPWLIERLNEDGD